MVQTLMLDNVVQALLRSVAIVVSGLVLIGGAWAHPGHHDVSRFADVDPIAQSNFHLGTVHVVAANSTHALTSRGCPSDDGGECCCDKLTAHPPPQPQPLAPPVIAPIAKTTFSSASVKVCRTVVHVVRLIIDSLGSRGPPFLLHVS